MSRLQQPGRGDSSTITAIPGGHRIRSVLASSLEEAQAKHESQSSDDDLDIPRHRFLSPAEWAILAHGVGAVRNNEQHAPVHPTDWWWPPRGMPAGLYKDVVFQRTKFFYYFHITSTFRWTLMILQLLIGATLTALGSLSLQNGTPITVLGAANTVIAGLLALLQNSGLPDRYRYNTADFDEVEDHIKELLDTGIAPANLSIDQIVAECFDLYQKAKATVAANMPMRYITRSANQYARQGRAFTPRTPHQSMTPLPNTQISGVRETKTASVGNDSSTPNEGR